MPFPPPSKDTNPFWAIIGAVGLAIGTGYVVKNALDLHSHTCAKCGSAWKHYGAFRMGDHDAHTCANCGEVQWWKDIGKDGAFRVGGK